MSGASAPQGNSSNSNQFYINGLHLQPIMNSLSGNTTFQNGTQVVLLKGRGKDTGDLTNPYTTTPEQLVLGFVTGTTFHRVQNGNKYSDREIVSITWETGYKNQYDLSDENVVLTNLENFRVQYDEIEKEKRMKTVDISAFDPLILASSVKDEIISVLHQVERHDHLFDTWGLGEKISYGKGMTMLFHGGPGTGKTWAAHCIAKSLSRELFIVDSAKIQSSEPGQANRNIQDAFQHATEQKKVLFIDECDSLIFNRQLIGMVLASEVNTLLTEIEKFEGICILATNRIGDMDPALERRLSLVLEFPFPDYESRLGIWKQMLPEKMPLDGISAEDLAKHELSGGLIKNVILNAARLASSRKADAVGHGDFERAIARVKSSKGKMGSRKNVGEGGGEVGVSTEKVSSFLDSYGKRET